MVGNGGRRWVLIALVAFASAGVVVAAVRLLDDDQPSGTSIAPGDAVSPTTPDGTGVPTATVTGPHLAFTVTDIADGGTIPTAFTCDGDDVAPTVTIESIPDGTVRLALLVDDPDAPRAEPFVHWIVYGIPAAAVEVTDGDDGLVYGTNDAGTETWFGPCPPRGDGPHHYRFTMYALGRDLGLGPGLDGRRFAEAIADATIDDADVVATYERAEG